MPVKCLSIKLHSVVCYSPINVHRTADKLNNVLYPLDINRTITHNKMQFNACFYIYVFLHLFYRLNIVFFFYYSNFHVLVFFECQANVNI